MADLIGSRTTGATTDSFADGQHHSFRFVASRTGKISQIETWIRENAAVTATGWRVAVYADASGEVGARIGPSVVSPTLPIIGTWHAVPGLDVPVVAGMAYWLSVLATGGFVGYDYGIGTGVPLRYTASGATDLTNPPPALSSGDFATIGIVGVDAALLPPPMYLPMTAQVLTG